MAMLNDKELLVKLLDDDEVQDVEIQKESPVTVEGVPVKTPSSKKKVDRQGSGSCCRCMCKCFGITVLTFTLAIILSLVYIYSKLDYIVDEFTVDTPKKFPVVEMPETELQKVIVRVDSFFDSVIDGKSDIKDLVLKQDEINGFIGHSDFLRGNLMVTLRENLIVEEFSIPMDQLGLGKRYFVGNDYLQLHHGEYEEEGEGLLEAKVETEAKHEDFFNGPLIFMQLQYLIKKSKDDEGQTMLKLFLENGSFFGQAAPQEYIDQHVNLLEGLYEPNNYEDDEDIQKILKVVNGIERILIEEGKVVVKAQHNSGK
jgi:hypothetical protein